MLDAKPIFLKDELSFQREEKDGYLSIMSKKRPEYQTKLVNPVARQIIDMCDGENDISHIIKHFLETYSDVPQKRIERDVVDTLVVMNQYGFIDWDGKNPFEADYDSYQKDINEDIKVYRADERYFRIVNALFRNFEVVADEKKHIYSAPGVVVQDYTELTLRQKQYSYSENFYVLTNKDNPAALISTLMELPASTAFSINFLLIDEDQGISKEDAVNYLIPFILEDQIISQFNATKLKWKHLDKGNKQYDWLIDLLTQHGFIKDYSSNNEHHVHDLHVYSKYFVEVI